MTTHLKNSTLYYITYTHICNHKIKGGISRGTWATLKHGKKDILKPGTRADDDQIKRVYDD